MLERPHQLDALAAVLELEVLALTGSDAVLAGAGALHLDRPDDHSGHQLPGAHELIGIVRVDQHDRVEVAVADVADDRRHEPRLLDVGPGQENALGQPRDRNADVRAQATGPGSQGQCRLVRPVPRLPQRAALRRIRSPVDVARAECTGELDHLGAELLDGGRRAMKLEEERRLDAVGKLVTAQNRVHLQLVEQLGPRERQPALDRGDHAVGGGGQGGNEQTAAVIDSGSGCTRRTASVTTPSVPSAPMNRCVRS